MTMNPYLDFVKNIQDGVRQAREIKVSCHREVWASDEKVLLFSPHPDDECITGLLALRLAREAGRQVVNVPVTFGSKVERQTERAAELVDACAYLGWSIARGRDGLQNLSVDEVVGLLRELRNALMGKPVAHAEGIFGNGKICMHRISTYPGTGISCNNNLIAYPRQAAMTSAKRMPMFFSAGGAPTLLSKRRGRP